MSEQWAERLNGLVEKLGTLLRVIFWITALVEVWWNKPESISNTKFSDLTLHAIGDQFVFVCALIFCGWALFNHEKGEGLSHKDWAKGGIVYILLLVVLFPIALSFFHEH